MFGGDYHSNFIRSSLINFCRILNATALVNMSATFRSDGIYRSLIMCLFQRSFRWWTLFSVCLFLPATVSFFVKALSDVLSEKIGVGGIQDSLSISNLCFVVISHNTLRSHVTCLAHDDIATYSDSAEDRSMTVFLWLFQDTDPPFMVTMYSVVEFRVSMHPPPSRQ